MKTPHPQHVGEGEASLGQHGLYELHARAGLDLDIPERWRVGAIGRDLPGEVDEIAVDDGVGVGAPRREAALLTWRICGLSLARATPTSATAPPAMARAAGASSRSAQEIATASGGTR